MYSANGVKLSLAAYDCFLQACAIGHWGDLAASIFEDVKKAHPQTGLNSSSYRSLLLAQRDSRVSMTRFRALFDDASSTKSALPLNVLVCAAHVVREKAASSPSAAVNFVQDVLEKVPNRVGRRGKKDRHELLTSMLEICMIAKDNSFVPQIVTAIVDDGIVQRCRDVRALMSFGVDAKDLTLVTELWDNFVQTGQRPDERMLHERIRGEMSRSPARARALLGEISETYGLSPMIHTTEMARGGAFDNAPTTDAVGQESLFEFLESDVGVETVVMGGAHNAGADATAQGAEEEREGGGGQ
eukprot:g5258.t1